jgi:hypothetical protein
MRDVAALFMVGLLALAGCGERACFQWNEADGACPDRKKAREFLAEYCPWWIEGEGELSDGACCYDVDAPSNEYCIDSSYNE